MAKKTTTKEDFAAIDAKNKALVQQMKDKSFTYLQQSDVEFKNDISSKSQEDLKILITSMKSTREFYKKILQEPYYIENPEKKSTHRYKDAEKKYNSVNRKGKIVHSLITN